MRTRSLESGTSLLSFFSLYVNGPVPLYGIFSFRVSPLSTACSLKFGSRWGGAAKTRQGPAAYLLCGKPVAQPGSRNRGHVDAFEFRKNVKPKKGYQGVLGTFSYSAVINQPWPHTFINNFALIPRLVPVRIGAQHPLGPAPPVARPMGKPHSKRKDLPEKLIRMGKDSAIDN